MTTHIRWLPVAVACLTAPAARAEPSPNRTAIQLRSAFNATRTASVPALSRLPGEGNDQVAARLLAALPRIAGDVGGGFTEAVENGRLRRVGRTWRLEVGDTGNNFRFRRITPSAHNLPLGLKPGRADVENQGRRVLSKLEGFLPLSADEQLIFMGTRYGYSGSQETGSPTAQTEVAGWAAVFGRSVGGELVIGGGSIVAVLFNADGTVEGIDGDWPRYQHTGVQLKLLPFTDIARRTQAIRVVPAGMSEVQTGVECGYFDPGGNKSIKQSILQPACAERVRQMTADGKRRAEVRFVPAAERPLKNLAWPELVHTCGRELCDDVAISSTSGVIQQPLHQITAPAQR